MFSRDVGFSVTFNTPNYYGVIVERQVTVFQQKNYLANFVQATLDALPADKIQGDQIAVHLHRHSRFS